jgi:peptidoglycan/LPS O-acetylase OafA/YrhL
VSSGSRRQEIQALRAIAVLLVVLFHLWPDAVPGGFVGVDVFFAISGFLITGLLLRDVQVLGTVSLSAFWARRARRLLPAPLVVLLLCAAATVAFVPLTAWDQFFTEFRASTAYVQNWHLASASVDYFAANDAPSPVRHFWSLSAEEQFYLVWPLLLAVLLAACHTWRGRTGVAFGAAVASAAAMTLLYHPGDDPTRVYYGTLTHAFGLLLGASAAFAWAGRAELLPRRSWARWLGPAALVLL